MPTPQPPADMVAAMEKFETFAVKYGLPKKAIVDLTIVFGDVMVPVKVRANAAIEEAMPNVMFVGGFLKHEGETLFDGAVDNFVAELTEAAEVAAVNG